MQHTPFKCTCEGIATWNPNKQKYVCEICMSEYDQPIKATPILSASDAAEKISGINQEFDPHKDKEAKPMSKRGICRECEREMSITGDGLCGRCYYKHHPKKYKKKKPKNIALDKFVKGKFKTKKDKAQLKREYKKASKILNKSIDTMPLPCQPSSEICSNCEYANICKHKDRVSNLDPIIIDDAEFGKISLLQCVYKKKEVNK